MQIHQLEMYCMVARLKSFSKAAKLLFMSQPAVSNQIQSLENYYGTRLFDRHTHGVSLTSTGEVVYDYAIKILDLHDYMEKEIDRVLNVENKKLVVGASSSVGNYSLPCSIWTFKDKYPEIEISLEIANTSSIIQYVLEERVHLGVVEGPIEHKDLASKDVSDDQLILIAPPTDEWLEYSQISIPDIKKHPLIMREHGSGIRKIWEDIVMNYSQIHLDEFKIIAEMGSTDAIKSAVESGLGIAVLSRLSVQKELRRGTLTGIEIEGVANAIKYQLVYRRDKFQPSLTSRFIRFLSRPEERSFC
jgi:LysR family transcriptional regulator, transcriptional activator of the cysJI operon